jgi:hypothetical protein
MIDKASASNLSLSANEGGVSPFSQLQEVANVAKYKFDKGNRLQADRLVYYFFLKIIWNSTS